MAIPLFPPSREGDLAAWTDNFNTQISATPTVFGLSAAQATTFSALAVSYVDKYAIAIEPSTNSREAIAAKTLAKQTLLAAPGGARQMVAIVQAFPGTTDTMRAALGLRARDAEPSPVPVPAVGPLLNVLWVANRTVTIILQDPTDKERRGKPKGVQGATVLTFVGDAAPSDPMAWTFAANSSKTKFTLDFPGSIAPGAKVWMTAMWFNARKETSPPSTPVFTRLNDSMGMGMSG